MGARLVVVLVVTGLFVLLPLWFAWLSMDSRRWQRVERILGREPSKEPHRWVWWAWIGLSAAYVVSGSLLIASARERFAGVFLLFQGVAFGVLASGSYLYWRRERERAGPGSPGAKVERGPEGPPGEAP
jgi:hypothetical protein